MFTFRSFCYFQLVLEYRLTEALHRLCLRSVSASPISAGKLSRPVPEFYNKLKAGPEMSHVGPSPCPESRVIPVQSQLSVPCPLVYRLISGS